MHTAIVEQTKAYKNRIKYDPVTQTFSEMPYESLMSARNFPYPYGWLKSSGTPPEPHLDVFIVTEETFALGDEVEIKIIGCFMRNDGDHKLIAVPLVRQINDWEDLTETEKAYFYELYPVADQGEGWVGSVEALEIIDAF